MQPRWPAGRLARALGVLLVMAGTVTGAGSAAASAASCQSWTGAQPLSPGSTENRLVGVAALSPCNVWAVGSYSGSSATLNLIEHWDGANWTMVASPSPGTRINFLSAVRAVSPADIWAVGFYVDQFGADRTLTLHWNGRKWAKVASPSPSKRASLTAVAATSADDAWAVGSFLSGSTDKSLILHWNGRKWARVASPSAGPGTDDTLAGVAVTASSNAWAVGSSFDSASRIAKVQLLHWNGRSWKVVPGPNPGSALNALSAVAASSSGNIWTVGRHASGGPLQALAFHCC
jgi:hypothetical protein